jgi:hypothetical protein
MCLRSSAVIAAAAMIAVGSGVASGQAPSGYRPVEGPHTLNPGDWPAHYPFADETEAAVAASEVHHVRYIDDHVRLVEVAYFPGVKGNMHGHPWPSVFAVDAPAPKATNTPFDPARNMQSVVSKPPDGAAYPWCRAASPQGLHHESNQDSFPHHFYRLEFLRIDGPELKDHWKQWYPRATGDRLLYEDDHVRLVEVLVRPGRTEARRGDPYPSVIAFDSAQDPKNPPGGKGGQASPTLSGFETLGCVSTGPRAPQAMRNTGTAPIHYYRIDFKRIDGDGIKDHWRQWYPWMATLTDAYARSPYKPNWEP